MADLRMAPLPQSEARRPPQNDGRGINGVVLQGVVMADYVKWLRGLADKGGKGVVDNIDARSLGRIAEELERLRTQERDYRSLMRSLLDMGGGDDHRSSSASSNKSGAE